MHLHALQKSDKETLVASEQFLISYRVHENVETNGLQFPAFYSEDSGLI